MSTTSARIQASHQLPPEIIPLIVEASLDPYDNGYFSKSDSKLRYSILKPYCLLNSTWGAFSQPKLLEWVDIHTEESANKFLEIAEQMGEMVKELSVEYAFESGENPSKLLRSTPGLVKLSLKSATVDASDLAGLHHLRRLNLQQCGIAGPPVSSLLCIPQLEEMSIYQGHLIDSPSYFLTPAFLPRLRRLHHVDFWLTQFRRSVPQLELFDAEWFAPAYDLLVHTSLLLLPLPYFSEDRVAMFSHLPRIPPFLFLDRVTMEHVQEALEDLLTSKKTGLRVLFVRGDGLDAASDSLIKQLVERGVRVERETEDLRYDLVIPKMEKILAEEKRAKEVAGLWWGY